MNNATLPLPVTESSSKIRRPRFYPLSFLPTLISTIRTNLSAGTPPSSSTSYDDHGDPQLDQNLDLPDPGNVVTSEEGDGFVSKVVVEQSWGSGTRSKPPTSDSSRPTSHDHKESKSGETPPDQIVVQPDVREVEADGVHSLYLACLLRVWLKIKQFFYPPPFDVGSEKKYDEDDWYSKKVLAQLASIWLIINLALGCVSVPRPWTVIDYIFYAGIAPVFTLPVFVMIMYNWPRDRRLFYQFYVVFALWMWPFDLILNMRLCGFYDSRIAIIPCNGKDFINILFFATAMQAIGLFGLRLERLPAAIAAAAWFVVSCALIIPDHLVWWRSVTNFAIFHIFLIWVHERRESSERRLYAMKVQVKVQYKALQRAQDAERRISESKHRLTSYVFHEVRVPLNSALLAAQSMEVSGTVSKSLEIEFDALMGSLTMMSQVLNDVLDFNRLDSGQFELVSKPYAFHQTIRSLFIPLQMATAQKGLTLHTELDPNIDKVARCAAYRAMGEREDVIQRHLKEHPTVDGVVVGDEARFRQIITNFASNACKFTSEGGTVTVKTKLVTPCIHGPLVTETEKDDLKAYDELSALRLAQHDYDHASNDDGTIVVRVEVTDTGCGIEESELTGSKLFSAFNQTERGKQQGGKGTGLGLALVRNIVKLSGGRLGVKSQFNKGSTFWVELPLGVGRKALIPSSPGINVIARADSQSDGSMGLDVAKVRAAAVQRETHSSDDDNKGLPSEDSCPIHVRTNNTLVKVVDAAALKASEIGSMNGVVSKPSTRYDLETSTGLGGDKPAPSSINSEATTVEPTVLLSSETPTNQPSSVTETQPTQRPTHIPIPAAPHWELAQSDTLRSTTISADTPDGPVPIASPLTLFDDSFSRPGLSVLVVDDDGITRMMMERLLRRQGCEVTTAENGRIALELMLGDEWNTDISESTRANNMSEDSDQFLQPMSSGLSKFAVVFLDNSMPVLSGLKTIEILRRLRRKDFVVGLTGNALLTDQDEYLHAGVDIVLTKPVMQDKLLYILKEADARRQHHRSSLQN
ncbi:Tco5, signal transduction HAMP domain histidine kinase [Lentinula raphanica]|nr:Tco5, signal transduction HAMP domain histidine kinase [Lentinula raphanica]